VAQYTAGEARLAIVPDASGFLKKLEADLASKRAQFAVQVTADTARGTAEIDKWLAEQSRKDIHVGVDVDTRTASAKAKSLESDFSKAFSALKVNAGALAIGNLPAMAAALTTVADAIQQVAQAGLALPGILAGVGASAGTLAVGLVGVKDAWSAIEKAADVSGGTQVRSANGVARAQRDLTNAYRDARRELEDLNLSLRGGQISEQQAIVNAQTARRDLQRDMASGQIKDQLDLQSRLLDIQQADQGVAESHQRNIELQEKANDANKRGVEGADQVVAAHEAVASAAATAGSATDAVSQAMAKLSPSARQFLETLVALKPGWKDLQQTIQENGFSGLSAQLRTLADADLPHLKTGMGSIATAWNVTVKQLFASLGSTSSQGFLDRILGNTADAQTRLAAAIDPVVHAFGTLTAAGSDTLPRLADDVGKLATRFDAFITAADSDGRLDKWINDGITGVEHLSNTLLNIGKIFTDITSVAGGGQGLLATLDEGSKKLEAFLSSTQGQAALRNFFQQAREDLRAWIPILQSLPGFLSGVMSAARAWTQAFLPPLQQISTFLGDHPRLIENVVVAFAAWKSVNGVASLFDSLTKINTLLRVAMPAAAAEGAAGTTAALAPLAAAGGPLIALAAAVATITTGLHSLADLASEKAQQGDRSMGDLLFGKNAFAAISPPSQPGTPSPSTGASTNDIPPAVKPSFAPPKPGTVIAPGPAMPGNQQPVTPVSPLDPNNPFYLPGHANGGVLPGYSPGKDNMLVPLAGGEGIVRPEAVRKYGPGVIHALNSGFWSGGITPTVDQNGNPVTPGQMPGPSGPIAPNPTAGGGGLLQNIIGGVTQGIQGPIGNVLALGQGLMPAAGTAGSVPPTGMSISDRLAGVPGLAGLAGSLGSSNPDLAMSSWGSKSAQYLGGFAAKTLGSFASTLWQGGLDFFGLGSSILSPSNVYDQAASKAGSFALGQDGPLAALLGGAGGAANLSGSDIGSQSVTLGDGSTIQIPTYGTSQGTPAGSASLTGSNLSPGAIAAIQYAQTHAVGQKYQYGGIGNTGGYDCSGIASAVFAAATGRPEGARYFTTESDFTALGFQPGYQQGALNIGIMRGGGGPNSHMALTLPNGVNVESGGASDSTQYGGSAAGALSSNFQLHYYLPLSGSQGVGSVPGVYAAGGPTPHGNGPLPDGGYPAVVHPGEFMISKRGRATVSDSFLHQLNAGQLKGFLAGGEIPDAAVPNRPNFTPTTTAHTINVPPPRPATVAPSKPSPSAPPQAPQAPQSPASVAPPAPQPPGQQASGGGLTQIASAPSNLDHNLPALSTAITSGFAAAGNIAGAAASMGLGGMGGGAASSMISGAFQQFGKIANDVANVGSSFLVGSVPGSFGGGDRAFGQTVMPQQNVPVTAPDRGSSVHNYYGVNDVDRVAELIDLRDAQGRAGLARYGG
jgi:hypothetical protein